MANKRIFPPSCGRASIAILVCAWVFGAGAASVSALDILPGRLPFGRAVPEPLLEMGPVLGYAGETFFTVSFKTDENAQAILKVAGREFYSVPGKYHAFLVPGLQPGKDYEYSVEIHEVEENKLAGAFGPYRVRTYPAAGGFTFAVYGDMRSQPEVWR
ncbi:MAG: hypothetical protein V1918_02985 [Planctomycetota bacterium]